ncbi:hypothetical protein [Microbacterium soli]|uniref:Peptidase M56 family protein n=1 Tax=Microbacterium soli TaxID=446075 RepID=A0ABP7N9I5_9MICO
MNSTLDPVFAAGIERELRAIGTSRSGLRRRQRRARVAVIVGGSLAVAGALTGAALLSGLPGQTTVAPFGDTVSGSYTGTAVVDLGPVPAGADRVILDITCTEGGGIEVQTLPGAGATAAGASWNCSDPIRENKTIHIDDGLLPANGSTEVTVTADPGTSWTVVARYGSSTTRPWGVNARGETYGVPNGNGTPDLVASRTTDGEVGYIRMTEQFAFEGEGYIKVYESDGVTQIGWFPIGDPATLGDPPAVEKQ